MWLSSTAEHEWIEMRLRARRPQRGDQRLGLRVEFARRRGAAHRDQRQVHPPRLEADLGAAGLALDGWYTDSAGAVRAVASLRRR